jgi:F-type H+-transporting ATPase subunit a
MIEHELWLTAILNKIFGGVLSALLSALGIHVADAAHPIPNYLAMELLVAALIIMGALILRKKLSVESPGTFQHIMETIVEFVRDMNEEIIGHGSARYVAMIGTLGIFIGICNILGLIPTFSTPTGHIQVTLGCAVAAFLYYNYQGVRHHGVAGYLKHFCGPIMMMAIIMFPIEIVGNVGRLLSLSVRLYANMFVGDILEAVFTGLIPIGVPALFMALHLFVSALQAYIFMLLPAIYISMAVSEEH